MLALVLAVGIVIDDAVVVHENIFRWMEEKGLGAWDAALGATKEIALAVVATTLSLVVIFLPIAFMSGRVGRFFFSFGVTTAVAIVMSMLVSFTMTPMLCSRFLKLSKHAREQGAAHHSGGIYGRFIEKPYLWTLRWSMRHRWAVVLATIAVFLTVVPLGKMVGKDFIPKDDQSEFEIAITTPEGWTLDRTDRTFREIEARLKAYPQVINLLTTIGDTTGKVSKAQGDVTQGSIYIRLVDLDERKPVDGRRWDQFTMMAEARKIMAQYPDLRSSVQLPAAVSSGSANADVEFTLVGPDLRKLSEYSARMIDSLRRVQGLGDVDTTTALRKPELRVLVNRERASDLGVNIQTIAATLRSFVGGQIVSDFKDNQLGELYDVWLRAEGVDRNDKSAVGRLKIPSTRAGLVELSNLARLEENRGPSQIDHFGRQRKVTIIANLAGSTMNVAVDAFNKAFADLHAPADYQLIASGRAKTQAESNGAFLVALVLSLVFMYMILAAQFESFVHPITILLAVPLTIPFALLSLILLGQALTIYSILGVFLLFGIVKKNGILQVDYTNVLRQRAADDPDVVPISMQGNPKSTRTWAVMEANRTRLRPILMTTLMLIAGMIPIALGVGPGSASRASMAKVIVGGQAMSLLLSLLVTPVAYSLFDDIAMWRRRRNVTSVARSTPPLAATRMQEAHPAGAQSAG
jgi:HAE1 family hydrophobic/amphiphilic exporter-1